MALPFGMNRRHFLKHVAGYSALALPGFEFIRTIQANAQTLRRNNKSVIIMWMGGGPATIDIWDLKPGRPTGGEFRQINTTAHGVQICEHMPQHRRADAAPGHHPLADHDRRRPQPRHAS